MIPLLITLSLIGCTNIESVIGVNGSNLETTSYDELTDSLESVESQSYDKVVANLKVASILDLQSSDDFSRDGSRENDMYFYFGRTTCVYCREFILKNKRTLIGMENFYYIDTSKMSKSEKKQLGKLGISEIPAIIRTTDGKILESVDLDDFIEGVDDAEE